MLIILRRSDLVDIWCNTCEYAQRGDPCFILWFCSRHKKDCDDVLLTCDLALKLEDDK